MQSIPSNHIKTFYKISCLLLLLSCFIGCNFSDKKETDNNTSQKKRSYLRDELSIQHGLELFNQHCASCHNFGQNEIGPDLSGVTSEVDKEWLKTFIDNPMLTIQNGDERAVALYNKYKLYMPPFPNIKDRDLEDLLGFIHKFSEGEKKNRKNRPGGLINPISEKIQESNLDLVIEEMFTIPPSSESFLKTRINKVLTVKMKQKERLFVVDLRGKLYEVVDTIADVFLDLKIEMEHFIDNPGRASGFGSFAFHPGFEENGLLYTTHTEPSKTLIADFSTPDSIRTKLQWVLTEWKIDDPFAKKFKGKKREVLRADMVSAIHGFQELTFNPLARFGDAEYGLLYLGIGDGGAALSGYPSLCDNDGKIWGSIIRIDPMGRNSNNGKYGIPGDNPYVDDSMKLDEIWCRGLRNPHRITWDGNGSGKMFVSNIGQHSVEEVNLGKAGANYGWPEREGSFLFDVDANTELVYPLPSDDSGYTYPVIQYDHDEGNAVSGGYAYAGESVPQLKGKYIFGDIPRGSLFFSETSELIEGQQATIYKMGLELNGAKTSLASIVQNERVDLRFGADSSGELLMITKSNGKVYKVVGCKANEQ